MKSQSSRMVRRGTRAGLVLLLGAVAALPGASGVMAGGRAGLGCPPGFVEVSSEGWLELPLNVAGVAAGAHTIASLTNLFDEVDHNGDAMICAQDVVERSANGVPWTYFYNAVDNNSSAANG